MCCCFLLWTQKGIIFLYCCMNPCCHTFIRLDQELEQLDGFLSADFSVLKVGTQLLAAELQTKVSKEVRVKQIGEGYLW